MKLDFNELLSYVKKGGFCVEKHPIADLYIFGYLSGPSTLNVQKEWNSTTRLMRGLIVDSEGNVVARAFEKFFTYKKRASEHSVLATEGEVIEIGNAPFKIFEKVDGTLSMLYWVNDKPYLATQRSFTSIKARHATRILYEKYEKLIPKLKKDRTYIFEAIYPECSVLINYGDKEDLVLLAEIDNETGISLDLEDIGFPMAKEYTKEYEFLSIDDLMSLNISNQEGFVLLFENNKRLKVKFPWYSRAHALLDKHLASEFATYKLEYDLKKSLGLDLTPPDRETIWARFRNGESPLSVLRDFPAPYYVVGIEEIIKTEFKDFLLARRKGEEAPHPSKNESFDLFKMMNDPRNELTMWNRLKRIKRNYL